MAMTIGGLGLNAGCRLVLGALVVAAAACSSESAHAPARLNGSSSSSGGDHPSGTDAGSMPGLGSGSSGAAASSGSGSGSLGSASSDDGGGTDGATATGNDAARGSSEAADDAPTTAPTCVTGQVTPNEVVMLGDSYLDAPWGNVGPTIMMKANAMYRHYYIGAASLAWGNPNTQFYIPYQFDPMALTDPAVTNPADIKVVIMDGGGNDVLIGNTSCETTAPPANTSCVTTIQNAIDVAQTKMQEMAQKGVQSVVYFFYPHLDPAGGGILLTPAPAVNDTLDYAYPLAEQMCCGTSFTSSATNYSCSGQPAAGLTCVFIDTRPAFEGHLADYIKSDNVHPTQAGAQVITDLIWAQMQSHCIAQ
jgi:hypothetical protein